MRIAFLPDGTSPNAVYRSIGPMTELARGGHETRMLEPGNHATWADALRWCDVFHVHRVCDGGVIEMARAAKAHGAAVLWEMMRERGVREGGGMTIGWVAGREHRLDAEQLGIASVLTRLLDAHPGLRVATLGLDLEPLGLRSDRYERIAPVSLPKLSRYVSTFDIGIAPLTPDVAINHARSSIKVKEYAALGVPWLASPIGPYAGLGKQEGGRLVPDGEWFTALDELLSSARTRQKLAKRAGRWGRTQLLSRSGAEWERALGALVGAARLSTV